MKFNHAAFLLSFLVVFMTFSSSAAQLDNFEDANSDEEEINNSSENISVSLKVDDDDSRRNDTGKVRRMMISASKFTDKREQIGQALPVIDKMPHEKLTPATFVSSKISNNEPALLPYDEIRSLINGENRMNSTRKLMLPMRIEIPEVLAQGGNSSELPEELPEAQELRLLMRPGRGRRPSFRTQSPPRRPPPISVNRRNVLPEGSRISSKRPSRRPTERKEPSTEDCTFFTKTVCLEDANYPHEAITRSIRGNKEMVAALLTDYKIEDDFDSYNDRPSSMPLENRYDKMRYDNRYENNEIKRRADYTSSYENIEEGFTCPSSVMYARPQLARAVSGVWKYIINTGEHTQTLRLEKCSNPKTSCSFISENYRSSCTQVYNYHRLLTWEASLGLHMDIFKVPTCCSCHVHGYVDLFPPIQKDPRPSNHESFPGAEFATENQGSSDPEEYSERPSSYLNKFKPSSPFDSNFLSNSKKPLVDAGSSNRPSFALPGRRKKPASAPRPFDKLPQQHAPNTRAPGYKGPITKSKRPARPNRPYRRESNTNLDDDNTPSSIGSNSRWNASDWSSQLYDQDIDVSTRLHNGGFDEEYQEPNRRVNYNYHPIIDFFKPEALMLQSSEPHLAMQTSKSQQVDSDSWKPMIST